VHLRSGDRWEGGGGGWVGPEGNRGVRDSVIIWGYNKRADTPRHG